MSKKGRIIEQVYTMPAFVDRDDLFERSWLFEGAIPHSSLGVLYAYRGTYKTWTAMSFALACAQGRDWLAYKGVDIQRKVLFVDGEMALPDFRNRWRLMLAGQEPPENLCVLTADDLAWNADRMLNLARGPDRKELLEAVIDLDVDVVVLDNRTSLLRGLDENDNSELDSFKSWLIHFRQEERSLLMVHHSGKSGELRGASALEDHLDYSIKLSRGPLDDVRLEWDKSRGAMPEPDELTLELETTCSAGAVNLKWRHLVTGD